MPWTEEHRGEAERPFGCREALAEVVEQLRASELTRAETERAHRVNRSVLIDERGLALA